MPPAGAPRRRAGGDDRAGEAASALGNLGYGQAQAERAVARALEELDEGAPLEDLIRAALRRVR